MAQPTRIPPGSRLTNLSVDEDGAHIHTAESDDVNYDYFALMTPERLEAVKKQISERETKLFELTMIEAQLDGLPEDVGYGQHLSHEDFHAAIEQERAAVEGAGQTYIQQRSCPCEKCELDRVRASIRGVVYGLNKLKAIYTGLSGGVPNTRRPSSPKPLPRERR